MLNLLLLYNLYLQMIKSKTDKATKAQNKQAIKTDTGRQNEKSKNIPNSKEFDHKSFLMSVHDQKLKWEELVIESTKNQIVTQSSIEQKLAQAKLEKEALLLHEEQLETDLGLIQEKLLEVEVESQINISDEISKSKQQNEEIESKVAKLEEEVILLRLINCRIND